MLYVLEGERPTPIVIANEGSVMRKKSVEHRDILADLFMLGALCAMLAADALRTEQPSLQRDRLALGRRKLERELSFDATYSKWDFIKAVVVVLCVAITIMALGAGSTFLIMKWSQIIPR